MKRAPQYIFDAATDTGIDAVPVGRQIVILDDGTGKSVTVTKKAFGSLTGTSTIADFLADGAVADMLGGSGASELGKVTEGSGSGAATGWRLLGRNQANYGNIGQDAVDFSGSESTSSTIGATGSKSFAEGYNTQASGNISHAEGYGTIADGNRSHTEGNYTTANGTNSHAEGNYTTSSGMNSHAEGSYTTSQNSNMHAAGQYNVGTATDTIHETGIGSSSGAKANAFEIYTDGRLHAPALSTALIADARSLVTKEYADALGGGSGSGASELEKVTVGSGSGAATGWRLLGRIPEDYGNIGQNAVDFSYSNGVRLNGGAAGLVSFAEGINVEVTGDYAHAEGKYTTASGSSSHAEGFYTTASGMNSHVEGKNSAATKDGSHAEGYYTQANGYFTHAEGDHTQANGNYGAHAEGRNTQANGNYGAHAEGQYTTATGNGTHVEGYHTTAVGNYSHAEGDHTTSQNVASHSAGKWNIGTATDTIHETGIGIDDANRKNAFEIYTDGRLHAPELTTALIADARSLVTKEYADALGGGGASELEKITEGSGSGAATGWRLLGRDPANYGNIGQGSIDFSYSNNASTSFGATGSYSFAEGYQTYATGQYSHAEGRSPEAAGYATHAEGYQTYAEGQNSHAEGRGTYTAGENSHAEGYKTIAQNTNSHAAGQYNTGTATDTIHETGIGSSSGAKANAFEIYTDGRLHAPALSTALIADARSLVTKEYADALGGGGASELEKVAAGSGSGAATGWRLLGRIPEDYGVIGQNAVDFSYSNGVRLNGGAAGLVSFAEGINVEVTGDYAHAEGKYTTASGSSSHAEGFYTTASGMNSHAEGKNSTSTSDGSHAEGYYTQSNGYFAHAEGDHTQANGNYGSHAEGRYAIATGNGSHAEGFHATSVGSYSHAEGSYTTSQNVNSHAAGQFNVGTATDTIHETGIGVDAANKANAFEIYTDGRLHAPALTTALIADARSLVTKEYADALGGGGASELEKLTEGSGSGAATGWRILGQDPANYGNIGQNAVDFSISISGSTTRGATGNYSFASGYQTIASGYQSTAEGYYSTASGDFSHAEGYQTQATDRGAHAEGYKSGAYGNYGSHAEGYQTSADGDSSHSEGNNTSASGVNSHAEGKYTTALNDDMHAAGRYNTAAAADTIHETGIGIDDANRANAFEIYTDGTLTAPEATPALVDSRGTQALVPVSYLLSAEFGASLPTTDPAVSGKIWNNAGVLNISSGGS